MGHVCSGRVAVFLCACGHGGRGVRLATVSLARWSLLSHRPMHAQPAWRWSVRARSVHGHVASAVVVLAVCGRVSRLSVGLFGVRSLSSQRVFAQSDLLCAGVPLVAMLVGARCVGPARYVCTVRRPPAAGEKSHDKWLDRCKKNFIFFPPIGALFPAPPWQCCMHNPFSGISWCPVAVLPVSLVPLICTLPSVAGLRRSPSVCPCAPHGSPRALLQLGGAVLVPVPVCLPCSFSCRAFRVTRVACLCHGAGCGG